MNAKFIAMCILFLLLGAAVMEAYHLYGVGWDFVAHYMAGKAMLAPGFFSSVKNAVATGGTYLDFGIVQTKNIYFESYRAPLSIITLAGLYLLAGRLAIPAYLAIMVVFLFFATVYFSKGFKINYLLVGSLLVLPYLVVFPFMINSEEMLSLIMMIAALPLLYRGKWQAGIFIGLAGLSKYTALIFLPLLLLVGGKKKILYSFIAFVVITLPWLAFNYAAFGNPLYSYLSSVVVNEESSMPSAISLVALEGIVAGFIPAIMLLLIMYYRHPRGSIAKIHRAFKAVTGAGHRMPLILASFFLLALLEFVVLGTHESVFDQARYGYFLFASIAFLLSWLIERKLRQRSLSRYRTAAIATLSAFSAASMIAVIALMGSSLIAFSPGSNNSVFPSAVNAVKGLNLSNCSFVSNDWVYLRYYGVTAFSPYGYNATTSGYPAIVFYGIGTNPGAVKTYSTNIMHQYSDFSIYASRNYSC